MALSRFSKLETRLSTSVDGLYAEAFALEPRGAGEFANSADPDRAGYEFSAVIDFKPALAVPSVSTTRMNDFASIHGDEIHVSIRLAALPSDRSAWPRAGDTIVLRDRPSEANLKVSAVDPDGLGRIVCRCMRTSR